MTCDLCRLRESEKTIDDIYFEDCQKLDSEPFSLCGECLREYLSVDTSPSEKYVRSGIFFRLDGQWYRGYSIRIPETGVPSYAYEPCEDPTIQQEEDISNASQS